MTEPTVTTETPDLAELLEKVTPKVVAHGAVRLIASVSVKMVVCAAIAQVVPTETKADKAKLAVGTYMLSGIATDAAKNYASKQLDHYLGYANLAISAATKGWKGEPLDPTESATETPAP